MNITVEQMGSEVKRRLVEIGYPQVVTGFMTLGIRSLARWREVSEAGFAFAILEVLLDHGLSGGPNLPMSKAVALAGAKCCTAIPDRIKTAAVASLLASGWVDTWDDPDGGPCARINLAGIVEVRSRQSDLANGTKEATRKRWRMVGAVLTVASVVFFVLTYRMIGR
jgi:hypothetical protein